MATDKVSRGDEEDMSGHSSVTQRMHLHRRLHTPQHTVALRALVWRCGKRPSAYPALMHLCS